MATIAGGVVSRSPPNEVTASSAARGRRRVHAPKPALACERTSRRTAWPAQILVVPNIPRPRGLS